jgi:hypothetical protein
MNYLLLFAGTVIGRVRLDGGEPAAGYLEAFPSYERVAAVFRREGDVLWLGGFAVDEASAGEVAAARDAEACRAQLSLATETGADAAAERVDFWDSTLDGEPPFVLVHFGEQPAAVPARLRRPPDADGGHANPPA